MTFITSQENNSLWEFVLPRWLRTVLSHDHLKMTKLDIDENRRYKSGEMKGNYNVVLSSDRNYMGCLYK